MPTAVPLAESHTPSNPPNLSKGLPRLTPRKRSQAEDPSSNPPPSTPTLPVAPDLSTHHFTKPVRRILSERDHALFRASPTHDLIVSFVFSLSDAVRDRTISDVEASPTARDPAIAALLAVLDEAEALLKRHPALDTGSRFGNPAFRDFLDAVDQALPGWHEKLGIRDAEGEGEVYTYLASAFGNGTRIDYGSGHELNFILWLLCLRQVSMFTDDVFAAITLIVFPRYLRVMRDIQSTYYLEPAGSHGVWGLDDYQFLPFLFGASQLVNHKHIRPMSIHNDLIVEECSKDFLYLDQIQWINATKTVQGLRWHSPMLDDISSAKNWAKVEGGMRKMFLAEVLDMSQDAEQRIGEEDVGEFEVTVDGMKHVHNSSSWGDCCGIKVPSAVGARQEAQKTGERAQLRRVPFD